MEESWHSSQTTNLSDYIRLLLCRLQVLGTALQRVAELERTTAQAPQLLKRAWQMILSAQPSAPSTEFLLASLRSTVHRLEQSENPVAVVLIKELLSERIAEIEIQAEESRSSIKQQIGRFWQARYSLDNSEVRFDLRLWIISAEPVKHPETILNLIRRHR
jgi:hypothetical protein